MATIVYVTPHQDDETLSMGSSVRAHLEAGHTVHVLLLTTGENSGARAATGLDLAAFAAARDDELTRAARRLGVRYSNVHLAHATEDGELTVAAAEAALLVFLIDHPDAWVKTYSHLPAPGRHADHVNTGQAAVNLLVNGTIINLRLYVEPWLLAAFKTANTGTSVSAEHASSVAAVRNALNEYKAKDGVGGKYGIGYLSVPAAFDQALADPVSWYHLPPTN